MSNLFGAEARSASRSKMRGARRSDRCAGTLKQVGGYRACESIYLEPKSWVWRVGELRNMMRMGGTNEKDASRAGPEHQNVRRAVRNA